MKNLVRHMSKMTLVAILMVSMLVLTGCTAVQISAHLTLKEDGSGSRTITASIAKKDYQDGYGSAYYYLTTHGNDLAEYLQTTYSTVVPGSEDWLTVSVDDSGSDWEVIDLTFEFTTFDDYSAKLASLAYDQAAAATYVAPEFTVKEDGTATYTENTAALTAIFKSLQTTIMADTLVFDAKSTKDGTALNDGSADLKSLTDFGVELMKPEFGDAFSVNLGTGEATVVAAAEGVFTFTGAYVAKTAVEVADSTDAVEEAAPVVDVPKTGESVTMLILSVICILGCAAGFIYSKKEKSMNR